MKTDEEMMLKAIREGNETAFRKLVDEYKVMIVNTCYAFVHNREDAEDIAQEVFITFYQTLQNFKAQCSISTWLYRIAVSRSINHCRSLRKRMRKVDVEEWNLSENPSSQDLLAWEHLEEDELKDLLHRAIDSLPERQRTALILNKYEELSYQEVADVMGVSLSSVESLIFRAKTNLEKIFRNWNE